MKGDSSQANPRKCARTLNFISASRFLLNFSFVALPPRRWRSARFWSSAFPTAAASERSSSGRRAQILIRTLDFQSCRFASRFLLNFSFVALPPRRWRSARFWSSTFPTAAASERSSSGRRTRKSLCTVVLPTASFAAHARTVAPVFSTYSAAARTRLSTSRFMAIPLFRILGANAPAFEAYAVDSPFDSAA